MSLPPVPSSFYWTREPWGHALRCRPLQSIAQHLFTTRQLALPSQDSWEQLAAAIGTSADRFITLTQVHGRDVVSIRHDRGLSFVRELQNARPDADAIVSNSPDAAIVVRAADCIPMLMADPRTGAVAAVHAGWRGTAARVGIAAIETLAREWQVKPEGLIVAIGPAIGPCCYEVGTDVVDAFAAAGHERYLIERWFFAPPSRDAFGQSYGPGSKLRLDVPGANRDQLILAGVREDNIHVAGLCTAMHLDLLTSYRAEKERAGRIAGVIRASATSPLTQ